MIDLYCDLLVRGKSPISEAACREWFGPAFEPFRNAGFLRVLPPSGRVLCETCFDQHWLDVEWDAAAQRRVARCPANGAFFVDDAETSMLVVDTGRCIQALQPALVEKKQRVRELLPGKAWHAGIAESSDIDWNAILVPGALTGQELALLAEETVKLPRCMLDVVLTGSREIWPDIRLPRTLYALPLPAIADWAGQGITIHQAILTRWLQSFLAGRTEHPARRGRPASKTAWLDENWQRYEADLRDLQTDNARARFLSDTYCKDTGGQKISRNTVVKLLDEVMPERVKNCQ